MTSLKGLKVSLPILIAVLAVGSVILVAVGFLIPDGPFTILIGSLVGIVYAYFTTRWFLSLPPETQDKFNPRKRWDEGSTRTVMSAIAVAVWAAALILSFNFLPTGAHAAIGAVNVVVMWGFIAYLLGPTNVAVPESGNYVAQDASMFNWAQYLFSDEAVAAAQHAGTPIRVTGKDLPLDEMQRAWNEEQEYLQQYKDSGGV